MELREKLLAMGCIEKKNHKGTIYYADINDEIIAKICSKCDEVKVLGEYSRHKRKTGGRDSVCKDCSGKNYNHWRQSNLHERLEYEKRYRKENKEKHKEYSRVHYASNKSIYAEHNRKWKSENKDRVLLLEQRRRARKQSLPNDLTLEQQNAIMTQFNNACALTGETSNLHIDHVIPLATGHGGTTYGNMIPLRGDLNSSKHDSNLFEWFESNRQRFNLSQAKFNALVKYLADVNEMTVKEYKAYYYGCFEGKSKEESA